MQQNIFRVTDVRGVYPDEINKDVVRIIAKATTIMLQGGLLLVAHDVRHGSPQLAEEARKTIEKTLKENNLDGKVEFVGMSSTPMFYYLVNHLNASGGLMITASHNPKNYNGVKIVREKAVMISGVELKEFIDKNKIQ